MRYYSFSCPIFAALFLISIREMRRESNLFSTDKTNSINGFFYNRQRQEKEKE